jgi:tetraacyldisaccharide 4'-kinase
MAKRIYEYLLYPVSGVYGGIIFLRNKLFDWEILPSREFDLPVISVGNITAGGTGKTPHVEYLVRLLKDSYRIAVLSRGFKRKTRGFLLSTVGSGPDEIGDEPCQIKEKFPDIMVAVDEKRVRGIEKLLEIDPGPDVIILDDAFQHRYVKPGLSILLEDFNRPLARDYLLPFGRLREFCSAKSRANIILVTKSPASMKAIDMRIKAREAGLHEFQHLYFTKMVADEVKPLFDGDFSEFKDLKPEILLFSGIANPRTLKPFARKISTKIEEIVFRDHYDYTEQDILRILSTFNKMEGDKKIILTTEKDSVKLVIFKELLKGIQDRVFYIPIRVDFLNNDKENFNSHIKNYVSSNKRNSILYQRKDTV